MREENSVASTPEGMRFSAPDRLEEATPLALRNWNGAAATRRTLVRVALDARDLRVRFTCAFDTLDVDPDLPRDRGVDRLWEHDVVEVFVAASSAAGPYREIEASPLGQWLALAFDAPRVRSQAPWTYTPTVAATIGDGEFVVDLTLALAGLGFAPAPASSALRIGLYRVHGPPGAREYLALTANGSAAPDFHRPSTWAHLTRRFRRRSA